MRQTVTWVDPERRLRLWRESHLDHGMSPQIKMTQLNQNERTENNHTWRNPLGLQARIQAALVMFYKQDSWETL